MSGGSDLTIGSAQIKPIYYKKPLLQELQVNIAYRKLFIHLNRFTIYNGYSERFFTTV